jgi:hypothetical protein
LKNSYKFIIDSPKNRIFLAGARDIVFHPGFYQHQDKKDVHKKIK